MNTRLKTLARVAAVAAFLLCLIGGLWILFHVGFKSKDDAVWTGLGSYFVGEAFFVGPQCCLSPQSSLAEDSRPNDAGWRKPAACWHVCDSI